MLSGNVFRFVAWSFDSMRLCEAAFEIERAATARGLEVKIEYELIDAITLAAYCWIEGADGPLILVINLDSPTSEASLDRDGVTRQLQGAAPPSSIH